MEYFVTLAHVPNPDLPDGYWPGSNRHLPPELVAIHSPAGAAAVCRAYIDAGNLGGGNWAGGRVYEMSGGEPTLVARVSYNGRLWSPDGEQSLDPED